MVSFSQLMPKRTDITLSRAFDSSIMIKVVRKNCIVCTYIVGVKRDLL
jgi:hypothetical protein